VKCTAIFTAPYNFDVEKADEGTQMELLEMQSDSSLKKTLVML
jgi:hypothetical protein